MGLGSSVLLLIDLRLGRLAFGSSIHGQIQPASARLGCAVPTVSVLGGQ